MAFPVTINGRTYTIADFEGQNYVDGFPDSLEDFVTEAGTTIATAAASATAASVSETNASTSATNAATSATNAATSETNAATSESNAALSATSAASSAASITGYDLGVISETKADTAVDVFVYDTSKDSDGGAWRKRTQHTSWYNETLNTATRGSRKEFPAVAVIVAESDKVTIYDGDDPSLPMWMVFNEVSGIWGNISGSATSLFMLNGLLCMGKNSNQGLSVWNFLSDIQYNFDDSIDVRAYGSIAERNTDNSSSYSIYSTERLVDDTINDVAMTVLPDAPIDAATGLPVPTIAVATDGGTSVIRDDGTVVDITGQTDDINMVAFTPNGQLLTNEKFDNYIAVYNIPSSDISYTAWERFYKEGDTPTYLPPIGFGGDITDVTAVGADGIASNASTKWLLQIAEDKQNPSGSLVNNITSSYNTGWMNGDIKGAFLADTDDTDLVGTELVTNGTFDTDSDWDKSGDWAISGGNANIVATTNSYLVQEGVLGNGVAKLVKVSWEQTITAGSRFRFFARNDTDNANATVVSGVGNGGNANGSGSFTSWVLTTDGLSVKFLAESGTSGTIDNVSIVEADADRSVNANPLTVNGTVTRSAVATGADLVAYSGFSAGNYLKQPYNADFDFGTGEFSYMLWFYAGGQGNQNIFNRLDSGATGSGCRLLIDGGGELDFTYWDAGSATTVSNILGSDIQGTNRWWHFVVSRGADGFFRFYLDGIFKTQRDVSSVNFDNSSAPLIIGANYTELGDADSTKMSLFRISATASSAEQIKKIYEDEKFLFQEGAQATLYGSSDAVTALAYDDSTELLHVGTSAGRSVFQGLRRVENTADAVDTAISASNNLVVEE